MAKLPFTIHRRGSRRYYYVAFKNPETGKNLPAISTKKEVKAEAVNVALGWLRDGVPSKHGAAVPVMERGLRDMARKSDVSPEDCAFICRELKRRGLLASYVMAETKAAVPLPDFLREFWTHDSSPYVMEKAWKGQPLSRNYTVGQMLAVEAHVVPFFSGRMLGEISRRDVEGFVRFMADKPLSGGRKNKVINALAVPLRWAFHKEMIDRDITAGIIMFAGKSVERQILSPEQAAAAFRVGWKDERTRLANMLAMVTGMRAGEIQGLRVQDLGDGCLYIRHSWNCRDGLKSTKNREIRTVEVPFQSIMDGLKNIARSNPHGAGMDGYVFWSGLLASKPMEADLFIGDLRAALEATGLSPSSAKTYTFHGWRHYFTAYMRDRVNEKLLKSQTGHKTTAMLEHYAGHVIAGDRERIREAQVAAFGGLLPDAVSGGEQARGDAFGADC